jgi:hypothetical protein
VLALNQRLARGSVFFATDHQGLADIALMRGDLARAEALYRRAVALLEGVAPGSETLGRALVWSVPDRSTARLMQRVYAGLKAGLPKDEALRQAQLAALRGRDASAT